MQVLCKCYEYILNNPLFCRGGSKLQFSFEIWSQITGGTNTFRKIAVLLFYFYIEISRSLLHYVPIVTVQKWEKHFSEGL